MPLFNFSSFLSSNNASIFVDKPFYHSGGVVQGYVLLNVTQAFECREVLLKVEGYEKVSWEERQEDSNFDNERNEWITTERYMPFMGEKDFFKVQTTLQQWPQMCQPGQYQFPFAFVLPMGLPGTFEHCDTQHTYGGIYYNYTKAKIKYKAKVECVVPGIIKHNIRSKVHLIVHQMLPKPPSEVISSHTQDVTTCCCSSNGSCSVSASVQKDSYAPGETACVLLEVRNESSANFSSVELGLRRRITISAGGGMQRLDDVVAKISSPGVGANETFMKPGARPLMLPLPATLQASTMGSLIECEYSLIVTLHASAFVSNVELKVPVLIYMPPPQTPFYPQPPPWWHATQVLPPVQLALPSAPPMPPMPQQMAGYPPQQAGYSPEQGGQQPPPGYQPPPYQQPPQPTYAGKTT